MLIVLIAYPDYEATLGAFGLGTALGWTSPALPSLQNGTVLGAVDESTQSWIGSIAPVCTLLSVITIPYHNGC